ncbi:MAG: 50S ribosomal protein L24 [Legionellaceae bacterium]|nr:50S ribosomal protein L24 [Legionellaceae bacterium]MBP9774474.1 50S ribosomal protein L24 [Legionellaceae bacterium]
MKRIQSKDKVIVTTGKSKGHIGLVRSVKGDKVFVEGANLIKKHVKPNPQLDQKGGIIQQEAPIHVSNVALYNPATSKADRVGFRFEEKNGKTVKVRYFKSNNDMVDAG